MGLASLKELVSAMQFCCGHLRYYRTRQTVVAWLLAFSCHGFLFLSASEGEGFKYGRMFPTNLPPKPTDAYLAKLDALGSALLSDDETNLTSCPVSRLPAGYTYFGQLVDHDLSFDRTKLEAAHDDVEHIENGRTPWLDLDQIYGGGPGASPALYEGTRDSEKFIIADGIDVPIANGYKMLGRQDLPLEKQDLRDAENALVLQMHVVFMRLHNKAIDQHLGCGNGTPFQKAERLVRWQYQYLVRTDYLPAIAQTQIVNEVENTGPRYKWGPAFFIPVEFSAAVFRFGHSMVRPQYEMRPGTQPIKLKDLVSLTLSTTKLPSALIVDWVEFFRGSGSPSAMEIDTHIAADLGKLSRYTTGVFSNPAEAAGVHLMTRGAEIDPTPLPVRTLKRGACMRIPSAQKVAEAMKMQDQQDHRPTDIVLLKNDQLLGKKNRNSQPDKSGDKMDDELLTDTPLFYYILREAEQQTTACGGKLGTIGSRIVADVLEGAYRNAPDHYPDDWTPPEWKIPANSHKRIESLSDLAEVAGK